MDVCVSQWKRERRLEVERAQQLAPEWAAIHESNWRIRMVFVTFDMPLASMVSTVNVVGNCWELLSLCAYNYDFLSWSLSLRN